jgi:hypothetical protein
MVGKINDKTDLLEKYSVGETGRSKQLLQAVSETMTLLSQVHNQVSCMFNELESLREDKVQNLIDHNDMALKSNAQQNALRLEINKVLRNEVERLMDGQTVIREDMADINQRSIMSFRDIQQNLSRIIANLANERLTKSSVPNSHKETFHGFDAQFKNPAEISTRLDSKIFNGSKQQVVRRLFFQIFIQVPLKLLAW